jgi:hypothetical protein
LKQQQEYTKEEIENQLLILEELAKEVMNRIILRLDKDISGDKEFWKSIRERYIKNEKGLYIYPVPKTIHDAFTKKSKMSKTKAILGRIISLRC